MELAARVAHSDLVPHSEEDDVKIYIRGFGGFRVDLDGEALSLPPITRTLLARLVLARGGLVELDELYRDVWPNPVLPVHRDQRVAVHKRMVEIRRRLGALSPGLPPVLLTERNARTGYRLLLDADQVDVHRFEDLISRAAATRDAVAAALLSQALELWTDGPLLGLPDKEFVREGVTRLRVLRERACRELAAVLAGLDRWSDAVAILDRLRSSQPADAGLRRLVDELYGGSGSIRIPLGSTPCVLCGGAS
jgi:DNA-binding SARP family transcriptional activator